MCFPYFICVKRMILVGGILWLMAGGQVWAEEETSEPKVPSWMARIENTAAVVMTGIKEVADDPVDELVTDIMEIVVDPASELMAGVGVAAADSYEDVLGGLTDITGVAADSANELVSDIERTIADPYGDVLGGLTNITGVATAPFAGVVKDFGEAIAVPIDIANVAVVSGAKDFIVIPVDSALTEIEEVVVDSAGYAITGVVTGCQEFVVVPIDNTLTRIQKTVKDTVENVVSASAVEALSEVPKTVGNAVESAMPSILIETLTESAETVADFTGSAIPAVPIGAGRAIVVAGNTWDELSFETQRKFAYRGLRSGMRLRTPAMAEVLYETIPRGVREMGEEAVLDFLGKNELSHIRSVKYFPELAEDLNNVIWEARTLNRARGGRTMTAIEIAAAQKALRNSGLKAVATSAAKGAAVGAAIEAPVAGLENYLHYRNGRMSADAAISDAAMSVAVAAVSTGAATYAAPYVISSLASAGITVSIGVLATPVMVGGIVVYAGYTGYRLCKAAQPEPSQSLSSYSLPFPQ